MYRRRETQLLFPPPPCPVGPTQNKLCMYVHTIHTYIRKPHSPLQIVDRRSGADSGSTLLSNSPLSYIYDNSPLFPGSYINKKVTPTTTTTTYIDDENNSGTFIFSV